MQNQSGNHYFTTMQQNDKNFKQSQSQYINYENKENNQQQYSTPIRSNSNNEFGGGNKTPLSPLSPQPMMLSPNEKMMILSPPKLPRNQNQQHHSLMLPPPSNIANGIPIQKRPTSNLFEYVSKQITTTTSLNNSIMLPSPQHQPTSSNNLNSEFTFAIPQTQSTKSTPSSSNNNTLNRKSAQQLKTFSKNGEEDHFSTKKREDRKSHQLSRQSSKRDVLIQNSRQQQLNQRSLSPPKGQVQTQAQIQQTIEEQQRIQHELKQQQLQEFLIKEKKRIESIKEVYSSEYTYCNHLNTIIENYLLPLRREYTTPEEVRFIVSIFSNIEGIRMINNGILTKIKDRIGSLSSSITSSHSLMISDLFIDAIPLLGTYIEYYVNYYRSLHSLDVWFSKCKKLKKFLDHDAMILKSLLIMPIQRIPRYSLLIDAVIRFTSPTHPDYQNLQLALEKMKQLTEQINERIRHSENIQRVTNIKFKFNDTIGFLDQTHRVLIKDSDNTLQLQPFKSVNLYNSNNNIDIDQQDTNTNSNKDSDDLTDDEDYGSNLILNSSFKRSISSIPVTPKKQQSKKSSSSTLSPSDCSLYLFNDTLLLGITSQHSNSNNQVDSQVDGNELDGRDQITSSSGSNGNGSGVIVNYKYNVVLKSNLVETFIRDYPKLAPTIFSIHHNSGTYLISTQTIEQRESWVREINDTIDRLVNSDQSLANRRSKISLKGTDDYGWYAFDSECSSQDTTLISRSLKELEENQIFTPKKRKSMITKVKQRMSSALSSPHKNQNVKRNSSFVLNSLVE